MKEQHTRPGDIERTSMAIISRELKERGAVLPEDMAAIIRRVIHTTADFDYVQTLCATPGAAELGQAALLRGTPIVTDTNMAKAGLSRPALAKLGGHAFCYMADEDVTRAAEEKGTTRAAAAADKGAQEHPGAVFAVGNAPTALMRLAELIEAGLRPALVIGVPVGFVNVAQSKETALAVCQACGVPAILAMGRKGGSNVAAAICNALLYQAAGMTNPAEREHGQNSSL